MKDMAYQRKRPHIPKTKQDILDLISRSEVNRLVEVRFLSDVLHFSSSIRYPATVRYIDARVLYLVIPSGKSESSPRDNAIEGVNIVISSTDNSFAETACEVERSLYSTQLGHILRVSNLDMQLSLRKFVRVPFHEKVSIWIADEGHEQDEAKLEVHALDLSGSGIGVHSRHKLGLTCGTSVRLAIRNPDFPGYDPSRGEAILHGKVARIFSDPNLPQSENLGINFEDEDKDAKSKREEEVARFCSQLAFVEEKADKHKELLDLTSDLTASLDIDTVLFKINASAAKFVSSEASSILLFDDQKLHLFFKTASGGKAPILNRVNVSKETGGIAWWVAQTGEPAIVNDVFSDGRFTGMVDDCTGFKTKSLIAVPIILEGEVLGVLEAVNKQEEEDRFTQRDLQLFISLADQIAIIVRNTQIRENYENFFTNAIELTVKAIESVGELVGLMSTGHCWRVASMAMAIGQQFGISETEFDDLYYGAALHDIGLLDGHYQKPSRIDYYDLSTGEEKSNCHAIAGANMVREVRLLQGIAPIIRHHHEHFDGTGYPDGLKADRIPLTARIVAVVEAYEEMLYNRKSEAEALSEIECRAGSQFDPEVVKRFLGQITQQE